MTYSKRLFNKSIIILFWLSIIVTFLFFPVLKSFFVYGKTINILVWPDMIEMKTIKAFEKQTGIKVNVNYYEGNEEVFTKMEVTKGKGYDLITITDVGVDLFRNQNLLKKIDKAKLKFIQEIDSHFLNHYFDPQNEYSVPYNWDIYGLGINLKHFNNEIPEESWRLVFDDKYAHKKITMVDDAYDAILLSALHLYGTIDLIDKHKLSEIEKLLIKQKSRVEIYDTIRADYFLKLGICSIIICQSIYIYRALQDAQDLAFVVPKEGGFLLIDSFVVPQVSEKDDLVYEFINFLYQEEHVKSLYDRAGFMPTLNKVLYSLNLDYIGGLDKVLDNKNFDKYYFLKRQVPAHHANELWVNLKAH